MTNTTHLAILIAFANQTDHVNVHNVSNLRVWAKESLDILGLCALFGAAKSHADEIDDSDLAMSLDDLATYLFNY